MMENSSQFRSNQRQARGLGSAKEGTHHWLAQRITALALIPLTVWLVFSLISLSLQTHLDFILWLSHPVSGTLMILFLLVAFHHGQLGIQVVMEDYIPNLNIRGPLIILTKFSSYFLATLGVVSVLKVIFEGL
tara:strand:+ start:310 stop:708 length:399 start_codon:yes stop_codon:yes gene_type:complete